MHKHHYLGSLPKIGETFWYLASWHDQWVALLRFCTPAWKCAARDRWIGWDFRHQYDRLHLVTNNSRYLVPSLSILRDVLIRVDPVHLDRALRQWNQAYAQDDQSLAIDGKTMRNALVEEGHQAHIMSVVGHQSKASHTQKKSALCP